MGTVMDDSRARRAADLGRRRAPRALAIVACAVCAGCAIVPRSEFDECKQLAKTLRTENARLKDHILALQSQNRDYSDRAVDDLRRLTAQDEAIERLDGSVRAYQAERNELEASYRQLVASLGTTALGQETGPPVKKTARRASAGAATPANSRTQKRPAEPSPE
jgi:hypothetical protein